MIFIFSYTEIHKETLRQTDFLFPNFLTVAPREWSEELEKKTFSNCESLSLKLSSMCYFSI